MASQQFDVFLAHNHEDKPLIQENYTHRLRGREILPWLDEREIPPGASFQTEIQKAIGQNKNSRYMYRGKRIRAMARARAEISNQSMY